jgi:hypothetical protein
MFSEKKKKRCEILTYFIIFLYHLFVVVIVLLHNCVQQRRVFLPMPPSHQSSGQHWPVARGQHGGYQLAARQEQQQC